MRILVLDEGETMNCELFREVPEHDIDRLDCGPQANVDGAFRSRWREVTKRIRRKEYDLAVVTDRKHCFWRPNVGMVSGLMRLAGASLWEPRRLAHLLVPRELTRVEIPWALMERNDQCLVREGNHLLFHLSTRVFVRELLQNRYEIFQTYREGSERMRLWPKAFRWGPRVPLDLEKILPISLGWRPGAIYAEPSSEKNHDIFFCGQTSMRTPRMAAVSELKESARREGWRFFCPERLTQKEFHRECARAWLCLSPSGNGWDCYRHYEALLTGSVPLINYPWIERYAPLEDGKHCFFFSVERGHLTEVVRKALSQKEQLKTTARAGGDLVRRYHSAKALRNYVIQETLQAVATKN
jgi:hypothetical protein